MSQRRTELGFGTRQNGFLLPSAETSPSPHVLPPPHGRCTEWLSAHLPSQLPVVPTCPQTCGLGDLRSFITAGLFLWAPLNLLVYRSESHRGGTDTYTLEVCVCLCVCVCVSVCVYLCNAAAVHLQLLFLKTHRGAADWIHGPEIHSMYKRRQSWVGC